MSDVFTRLVNVLSSMKTAIVLFTAIVLAAIVGTFIPDFPVARRYVYEAPWFLGLLAAFGLCLATCMLVKKLLPPRKTALFLTHSGVLVTLVGTIVSAIGGIRGNVILSQGQMTRAFHVEDSAKVEHLGFEITLDRFQIDFYPPVIMTRVPSQEKPLTFEVEAGKTYAVEGKRLTVLEYFPNYVRKEIVVELLDGAVNPAVLLRTHSAHAAEQAQEMWVFDNRKGWDELSTADGLLTAVFQWCATEESYNAALESDYDAEEYLSASVGGGCEPVKLPIEIGVRREVGESGYTVTIERYVPDFRYRDEPGEKPPLNPALQVQVEGPQETEKRWVFSRFPDFDKIHEAKTGNLQLVYRRPAFRRVALVAGPGLPLTALLVRQGQDKTKHEWKPGETYPVDGTPYTLEVAKVVERASVTTQEANEGTEVVNPAVRIAVDGAVGRREVLLTAADHRWFHYGPDLAFIYAGTGTPKSFKSHVTVSYGGEKQESAVIEVNRPFRYGKYTFYQSSYDTEGLTWSGLQVVYDPGVWIVYFGFAVIGVGLFGSLGGKVFRGKLEKEE